MALLYWETTEAGRFVFGETWQGRLRAAGLRVAWAAGLGTLALFVLLGPDYVFSYRHIEPQAGAAALAMLLLALLLALLLGVVRVSMREVWQLDGPAGELLMERSTLGREPHTEQIALADVRAVRLVDEGARLELVFSGGEAITIAAGKAAHPELAGLADALAAWAAAHAPTLTVERPQRSTSAPAR